MQFKNLILTSFVAAMMGGGVQAWTGKALWDSLGTTPCPVSCPLTDFRVALPQDMFPNGENCCSTVFVSYEGKNVQGTFTDLCLWCVGSQNISLSHELFAELAPLEVGSIEPVVWNL